MPTTAEAAVVSDSRHKSGEMDVGSSNPVMNGSPNRAIVDRNDLTSSISSSNRVGVTWSIQILDSAHCAKLESFWSIPVSSSREKYIESPSMMMNVGAVGSNPTASNDASQSSVRRLPGTGIIVSGSETNCENRA